MDVSNYTGTDLLRCMVIGLVLALPGPVLAEVLPAEGLWFNRAEPGSGLTIEQQGNTLVVTVYTYGEGGEALWGLASGKYHGGEIFDAPLLLFGGGTPIESPAYTPASVVEERDLRLRFYGDVYASLSIDGSEPQPIVPQQFGWFPQGENVASPFEDVSFLIPDLDAAWLLSGRKFGSDLGIRFESKGISVEFDPIPEFDPLEGRLPAFEYSTGERTTFNCDTSARSEDLADICLMTSQAGTAPASQYGLYVFPVSGLDWHVWRGSLYFSERLWISVAEYLNTPPPDRRFVVNRLGNSSYEVFDFDFNAPQHSFAPANGMWLIEDRPGSGLVLEQKESILVVTLYTYDEGGNRVWFLASGQLEDPFVFSGELHRFANGSPFDSDGEHRDPEIVESREIRIEFRSANFAELSIDGSTPVEIRSFNFAFPRDFKVTRRLGPSDIRDRSFPGLSGHWEFAALDPKVDRALSLMIGEPVDMPNGIAYPAVGPDGEEFTIACNARGPQPKCIVSSNSVENPILRFNAGDVGTGRILAVFSNPDGRFGARSPQAWGFRIHPITEQ